MKNKMILALSFSLSLSLPLFGTKRISDDDLKEIKYRLVDLHKKTVLGILYVNSHSDSHSADYSDDNCDRHSYFTY